MDQTVFISSKNTATFSCLKCGKTKTVDVGRYATTDRKVMVNCTCPCGHRFRCRLEKRKQYRKGANLPGKFTLMGKNGPVYTGLANIVDISTTGLKLKMNVSRTFSVGDILIVSFHLDDRQRTPMEKRVIVRNVSDSFVGASFHPSEPDDPALGFYLMP